MFVNQSFIPEVGAPLLTNMHSDLRFNPSSGLCINLDIAERLSGRLLIVQCGLLAFVCISESR